jgi:serine/threonine protein kinase
LERLLGSGGMGRVYLGRSVSGRRVAVKVIRPEFAADPGFRERFRQETDAARRVSGAFTAAVVDADPDGDPPWMATVYIPGPSLRERVAAGPPLGERELHGLAAGLAEALRDIHRAGLIHRDLTPGNILLSDDGPRVIDFGVARAAVGKGLTRTGLAVGTPPFMSPEQVRGSAPVGPASDVFAFGSVMAYAATGRGPFDAADSFATAYRVVHEDPDLAGTPEWLAPLLADCLAKSPAERPTPDELLRRLAAVSPAEEETVAEPGPPAPPPADAVTSAAPAVPPEPAPPTRVDRPVPVRTALGVPRDLGSEPEERTVRFLDSPAGSRRGPAVLAAVGAVCAVGAAFLAAYLGGALHHGSPSSGPTSHSSGPSAAATPSHTPSGTPDPAPTAVTVKVRAAHGPCFLLVRDGNGREVFSRVLPMGSSHNFTDRKKLKLTFGDATAVDVTVNGRDVGPVGLPGQIVTLTYLPGDLP